MDKFISNKFPFHTEINVNVNLDYENSQLLKEFVLKLIEEGEKNFLFEMENVEIFTSEAVGTIIYLFQIVRKKGGDIKYVYLHPTVTGTFELLRLTRVFEIFNDLDFARRCFEFR